MASTSTPGSTPGASIAVALIVAWLITRAFRSRGARVAAERSGPEGATRLRFIGRLLSTIVVVIGIVVALSGFTGISQLATSLLASGAIAAAIVGFAARQTLANFIAGIMLAITQPIRVGDWVTFEGNYGVVEDVSLNHTVLRTADRAADRDPEREARGRRAQERHAQDRPGRARRHGLGAARGRRGGARSPRSRTRRARR